MLGQLAEVVAMMPGLNGGGDRAEWVWVGKVASKRTFDRGRMIVADAPQSLAFLRDFILKIILNARHSGSDFVE